MKMISIISILTLLFISAGASVLWAASDKCVVVEAEGKKIVLECGKDTSKFEEGTRIKIKTDRKSAAIEGC